MKMQFLTYVLTLLTCLSLASQTGLAFQDGDDELNRNPLLLPWDGPYGGVPPWKSIDSDTFVESFKTAIEMAKADIDKIASQTEDPTFENTFVPLEKSGAALDRIEQIFGVYTSNLNLGKIPDMESEIAPMMSQYSDWVIQHEGLFKRIEAVCSTATK